MAVACLGGGDDRLDFSYGPIYIGIHDVDSFVVSFSLVFLCVVSCLRFCLTLLFFFLWLLGGPSGYYFSGLVWVDVYLF